MFLFYVFWIVLIIKLEKPLRSRFFVGFVFELFNILKKWWLYDRSWHDRSEACFRSFVVESWLVFMQVLPMASALSLLISSGSKLFALTTFPFYFSSQTQTSPGDLWSPSNGHNSSLIDLDYRTVNIIAENVGRSSLSFSHFHRLGGSCSYSWVSPTLCSFCIFFYSCVVTLVLQCVFMYGGNMKIQPIQISLADSRFIGRMKIRGRA